MCAPSSPGEVTRSHLNSIYLDERNQDGRAEGAGDAEGPARGGGEEDDLADGWGAVGGEPGDAGDPEHEPDCGLDGVEGDPGGEPVGEGDALGLEGEGDGAARDADVAGGEGDHPGDLEGGDDHDRGGERVVEPERGGDGGGGGEAAGGRDCDPGNEAEGGRGVAAEGAERIEQVAGAAVRVAVPGADRDGRRGGDEAERGEERPEREGAA